MGLDKINLFRKQKGMTTEHLAEKSGIPLSTIKKICAGITTNPNLDTVKAIARALNCKIDDFDDDSANQSEWSIRGNSELSHIKKYRLLTPAGQKAANENIETLLRLEEAIQPEPDNIIPLRISEQAASAGRGAYLGPESFRIIDVLDNDMTHHAGFAVPVSGDSMEPKYHDGDILLIADMPVEAGDIGLFTLDGCGYVKKLGDGELLSLNPEYDPIPLDDSIICNGKVIGILSQKWIMGED